MAFPDTDWKPRRSKLDVKDPDTNDSLVVPITSSDYVPVFIDLGPRLAEGEDIINPTATFVRIRTVGETDDEDVTSLLSDDSLEIAGTRVIQRIHGLEPGFYYRLAVSFGDVKVRRTAYLWIFCPE